MERSILSSVTVIGALAATIFMMADIDAKANSITAERRPELRSSGEDPGAAFDGDAKTFWSGRFVGGGRGSDRFDPASNITYIQFESGTSHSPGEPPKIDPPHELIITNGAPDDRFPDYARPSRIRILVFTQEIVDVDREYRFPAPPSLFAERTLPLPDRPGEIRLPLSWIPSFQKSDRFPENIYRIWIRLEMVDIHRGKRDPDAIAFTELRIERKRSPGDGGGENR